MKQFGSRDSDSVLFFFPHAGASASSYYRFANVASEISEVFVIQLPGRGERVQEPFPDDFNQLTNELCGEIAPLLKSKTIFFGHSFGGVLAYEVACQLSCASPSSAYGHPPTLFLSGCRHRSSLPRSGDLLHKLPSKELRSALFDMGGIPEELARSEVFMDFIEPVVRADLKILESHLMSDVATSIPCVLCNGVDDPGVQDFDIKKWLEVLKGDVSIEEFEGDHFYLFRDENMNRLVKLFSREMDKIADEGLKSVKL